MDWLARQVTNILGVPLIKGGKFVAGLAVHTIEPRDWTPDEIALVEETAERTWRAVERARAEVSLRESEARLSLLIESAHVIKLAGLPNANLQHAREVIERQMQHLTHLVDDLLDVSRITRGKITLQRELLNLSTIINRAVETSRPHIDLRKHRLTVTVPPEKAALLRVEGDQTRLVQVVSNLLNNAAKYTDEGGQIGISAASENGQAVIRVRDNRGARSPVTDNRKIAVAQRKRDLITTSPSRLSRTISKRCLIRLAKVRRTRDEPIPNRGIVIAVLSSPEYWPEE